MALLVVLLLFLLTLFVAQPHLFDFLQPIQASPLPATTTVYAYGPSGLLSKQTGGEVSYYHTDSLGSSSLVTDTNGNRVYYSDYEPFGDSLHTSGEERYTYTGKELDASTGLYYYGARYYDSSLGRFISSDPVSGNQYNSQRLNRYTYVLNNPMVYTDPTGMEVEIPNENERQTILAAFNELVGSDVVSLSEKNGRFFLAGPTVEEYKGSYPNTYTFLQALMVHPEIIQIRLTDGATTSPKTILEYYSLEGSLLGKEEHVFAGSKGQFIEREYKNALDYSGGPIVYEGKPATLVGKSLSGFNEIYFSPTGSEIFNLVPGGGKNPREPMPGYLVLYHELGHAFYYLAEKPYSVYGDVEGMYSTPLSLGGGVAFENIARKEHGLPPRLFYITGALTMQPGPPSP